MNISLAQERYDYLVENGVCSKETVDTAASLDGFTAQLMDDVLFILTGEHFTDGEASTYMDEEDF